MSFDYKKEFDISIYDVGKETCIPGKNIVSYNSKSWHQLHYITSGRGVYILNNKKYELKKGDIFYIPPFANPAYHPDKENPWSYIWVGFEGACCSSLLNYLEITNENPVFSDSKMELKEYFNNIALAYIYNQEINLLCLGNLYNIFGTLVNKKNINTSRVKLSAKEANVLQAKEYMRNNYQFDITVKDIADNLNLSPNYLANIFEEIDNSSPKKYLIDLRMNKAKELLMNKNMKIKEISALCGYPNQLHFSAEFKKRFGVSPKEYVERNMM